MSTAKEQRHPLYHVDRLVVDQLLLSDPDDYALAEWARLYIRYQNFPGARDIQRDLAQTLERWGLALEEVFQRTRAIHQQGLVYRGRATAQEDWN
ncbi:MAG: DUF3288 family protein [Gloeomargarita sp. SKYBB_i_bin120]|nr:DUF3288 family protein [Gloeomargarita sp. SKYG98]MCS7292664.1 DUF3288 family protein [Gloeomargarita sp. SKYB120]MDW8178226.1 DUF3288 family protein [Gloeomargarita sp. SKYBB_i_bin120]